MGSKWLRNGSGIPGNNSGGGGGSVADKVSTVNVGEMQQPSNKSGIDFQTTSLNKGGIIGCSGGNQDDFNMIDHNLPSGYILNRALEGNIVGPDSIPVLDPKRRRVDLDSGYNQNSCLTHDQNTGMEPVEGDMHASKNESLAGAAVQTRQSL